MNRPFRTAAILTLSVTYIALWVAFVTTGDEPPESVEPSHWLLSAAASVFLVGIVYAMGLFMASIAEADAIGHPWGVPSLSTVVFALVSVAALLGLVASLRSVLWGGPTWLRWAIVGLATGVMAMGSGRAIGWAAVGGLIWSGLGLWSGVGRDPIQRVDLMLTGLMVGTTVGAVGGTLWHSWRERRRRLR
jgi:hypothetical protein